MSVRTCKVEPVKGQALLRSSQTEQDVTPSLVSPPSSLTMASRSSGHVNREPTKISSSSWEKWTGSFSHMLELRRKIITFRDIIDLPHLTGYRSITNMVMRTMEDLHELCPEIVESSCLLDTDKLLDQFYIALKSIGDTWIDDHEWFIKSKYLNSSGHRKNLSHRLGEECSQEVTSLLRRRLTHSRIEKLERVLAALDRLITGSNEMLNEEEKQKVTTPPQSKTPSKRASSPSKSVMKRPLTPRTVLHPPRDIEISVSNLPRHVRMQALVILSPIEVKGFTIQQNMWKKEAQSNESVKEKQKRELERIQKMEKAIHEDKDRVKSQADDKSYSKGSEKPETALESLGLTPSPPGVAALLPPQPLPVAATKGPAALPPQPPGVAALLPPQPLPMAAAKGPAAPPLKPPGVAALPSPQPLPMAVAKGPAAPPPPPRAASLPSPQPLPIAAAKGPAAPPQPPGVSAPLPPQSLPMIPGKGTAAPPPQPPGVAALLPPLLLPLATAKGPAAPAPQPAGVSAPLPPQSLPMAPGKGPGAAPPPPPPLRLGAKKATGKLKRSTKLGELYRFLKTKIEGKDPKPRPRGVGGGSKGVGGKQGMADALAEITKRSPYFQQIEEDVKMYMKAINELKKEISTFKSKDMTELQRFHLYIESVLGKLTDERQVLKRCEGFPEDKLDAIRMASALHSKLQGMIKELKNWKIESPATLLFDKIERYFAKIRREIETLDQIKVEEEKKFKRHNIPFDFSILTRIKESMVDISSGCIELALKEEREAKMASHTAESRKPKASMIKNKTVGLAKKLWRAFHFAYRVYTFAGGHDDRADKLTRELGSEIELVLKSQ